MKAVNILWDIDIEEAYERLDELSNEVAAQELDIPLQTYANMTTEERHDWAYDRFHHNRVALDEFMGLPSTIDIPEGLTEIDDISDWVSDEYGFCHGGFDLVD
jgi:hypothetical protein